MPDVFISYHSEDRAAVAIIADELQKLKLAVWFDAALRSGSVYDTQISQQLETARAVLTCWTPGAAKSDWVRAEAVIARSRDKLVPCMLQATDIPPPFNLTQAPDLSTWAGQDDDPAWLKTLERIGQLTDRPPWPCGLSGGHAAFGDARRAEGLGQRERY
jgi:TIR domain